MRSPCADPDGRAPRKAEDAKEDRWRSFGRVEVERAGWKLDAFRWLREEREDDADDLPEPEELIGEIVTDLEAALTGLRTIAATLPRGPGGQA